MASLSRVYSAVTRGALLLATFLIPITVLPWASEPLEIHKQTITVVLVIVATLGWLGTVLVQRQLTLQKRAVFLLPVVLVAAGLLSPGLSSSPYLSIVGQAGQEYTSVLSIALFALMAMLVAQQSGVHRLQRQWFTALLLSSGVVALYTVFVASGFAGAGMPLTLIGTPNACAVYLLAMTALGCGFWLTSRGEGEDDVLPNGALGVLVRMATILSAAVLFYLLLVLDYQVLWILTLVAMGSIGAFALVRAQEFPHVGKFLFPMMLFVAALVFLFLPSPFNGPFPAEVGMSTRGTWQVVRGAWGSHGALFGSGPGTFGFAYEQFHDPAIAQSDFWDVTFDRGSSHVLTLFATFGIIGTLAYVMFSLSIGTAVFTKLAREKAHGEWKYTFAPAIAWLTLASAQLLYPSNFTLSFLFWLLSGVLLSHIATRSWSGNFSQSPRIALVSAFAAVLMLVGLIVTLFVAGSRYAADIAFARAVAKSEAGVNIDTILTDLDSAALTNRWSDIYYRNLSHALLLKTGEALRDATTDPAFIKDLIGASVNAALRATALSDANVANWKAQGDVYREVGPLVAGADDYAIAAYLEVIARAPSNPRYYVDAARGYMVKADNMLVAIAGDDAAAAATAQSMRTEALAAAAAQLGKAIALREAYAPAHFLMAYVLERQGKVSDAIVSMEHLKQTDSYDVGVAFQLGLLYLKQGKATQAKSELERALTLAPNYANAHWYLASIYEGDGDFAAAIREIEAIMKTDPENGTVRQRLQGLQDGLIASQLPDPLEEVPEGTTDTILPE